MYLGEGEGYVSVQPYANPWYLYKYHDTDRIPNIEINGYPAKSDIQHIHYNYFQRGEFEILNHPSIFNLQS